MDFSNTNIQIVIILITILIIGGFIYYKRYKPIIIPTPTPSKNITIPTPGKNVPTPTPTKRISIPTPTPTKRNLTLAPTTPASTTPASTTPAPIIYIYTSPPLTTIGSSIVGDWDSFYYGMDYGRVIITQVELNTFNISGLNLSESSSMRYLEYNPDTKIFRLGNNRDVKADIGTATFDNNGKAIRIGRAFSRSIVNNPITPTPIPSQSTINNPITPTPIPSQSTINPFIGVWNSYRYSGIEEGPVSITYRENGIYDISPIPNGRYMNDYLKELSIDPKNLRCTLPRLGYYGYIGIATIINGVGKSISGNGISISR